MYKQDDDDEVFFELEGSIILKTDDINFKLNQYEEICVPKGILHRPIEESKAVVLMIANEGIDPIGK